MIPRGLFQLLPFCDSVTKVFYYCGSHYPALSTQLGPCDFRAVKGLAAAPPSLLWEGTLCLPSRQAPSESPRAFSPARNKMDMIGNADEEIFFTLIVGICCNSRSNSLIQGSEPIHA